MKNSYCWACTALVALVIAVASPSSAQQYKMSTPVAPGVAAPDKIDTSIGTLKLSDGNPDPETVK